MADSRAPLKDIHFTLFDTLNAEQHYAALVGCEPVNEELLTAILDEGARFCDTELAPINRSGDEQGCHLIDGKVVTPDGFKEAYKTYQALGWSGMTGEVANGGQGLPESVSVVVEDMISQANLAWAMYPGLSRGAMEALEAHGSDEQKEKYLTRLLSGEWTGTMCLTEPHCGSDVGLLRTKAIVQADGTYAITGTKIFISAGDHDFTDNIIHLVLARTPDAPSGTKGVSLFIVPKITLDGQPNKVECSALEEKMGIHGNATSVLNFDNAIGQLVGELNKGMSYMFTMMNGARLVVGLYGVSLAEAGYQKSLAYAKERLQMRSLSGPKNPDGPADPIIVHPDVRRMLFTQKAFIEGGRAFVYYSALMGDTSRYGATREIRDEALELLEFLLPIVKGFLTEVGFESANHAVQIFGGHGFIRETGVEQHVRDSRITTIYEGTTQIQALDLLGRKVLLDQGKTLMRFLGVMNQVAESVHADFPEMAQALKEITKIWGDLSLELGGLGQKDPDAIGAASVDYLMLCGYACLSLMWAQTAMAALAGDQSDPFIQGKLATAKFYFARIVPRIAMHDSSARSGQAVLMGLDESGFDHL